MTPDDQRKNGAASGRGGRKDRAKRCERRSLSLRRAERNGNSHDNKENDEEKMDITHCRLPCGDAARRRAVLPAGKRGGLRGVAGCEPEHRAEGESERKGARLHPAQRGREGHPCGYGQRRRSQGRKARRGGERHRGEPRAKRLSRQHFLRHHDLGGGQGYRSRGKTPARADEHRGRCFADKRIEGVRPDADADAGRGTYAAGAGKQHFDRKGGAGEPRSHHQSVAQV